MEIGIVIILFKAYEKRKLFHIQCLAIYIGQADALLSHLSDIYADVLCEAFIDCAINFPQNAGPHVD